MRRATMSVAFVSLLLAMKPGGAEASDKLIDLGLARATNAEISAGPGGMGLTVRFLPSQWPGVQFDAPEGQAWDWRGQGSLVLELSNPGAQEVAFSVRVDDDKQADGRRHCRTAQGRLGAGETGRFAVGFGPDPMSVGMRGLPVTADARGLATTGETELDLSHVVGFRVFLVSPQEPVELVLKQASLGAEVKLEGMVDRFGQYAHGEWPGKLTGGEEELVQRRLEEESRLEKATALEGRNRFGGWAKGPLLEATGFFRTERVDGTWWLVDPEGRLFFSSGVDCVDPNEATIVTGRESFFAWLPEPADPLSAFYGRVNRVHLGPVSEGRTFDFYRANLFRNYGEGWEPAWRETAFKRLPAWGFNTIGNWSSRAVYGNNRVPYVATVTVSGRHARVSSGSDYWGEMHDVFDPQFAQDVEGSIRDVAGLVKNDPWCVGFFVDNELSWGSFDLKDEKGRYGLAFGALAAEAGSPAKAAFVGRLKAKYETIERFNEAWDTELASWEVLEGASWKLPGEKLSEGMKPDLSAFVTELAERYFRTVRESLERQSPGHLYLGCRFAWKTTEAIEAAVRYCDVVSFNIYDRRVDSEKWAFLNEMGKPAIIGEFHVGALDRGMLHTGLVSSASQEERATVFGDYVGSVLDHRALVGCHWFQYEDQPLTGRAHDGENYNIGFVTVTDTPYPEMVEAAQAVHREMYERRAALGGGEKTKVRSAD